MPTGLIKAEKQRRVRKILGRVDVSGGTPSIGAGAGFTIADTAPGQVTVTLTKPGRSILCAVATPLQTTDATGHLVKVDAVTEASSVVFNVYKVGGAAATLSATAATLSTANTYTDAAVKAAIDDAMTAITAKILTALDLQDGILADNVGFYFEITVKDVSN